MPPHDFFEDAVDKFPRRTESAAETTGGSKKRLNFPRQIRPITKAALAPISSRRLTRFDRCHAFPEAVLPLPWRLGLAKRM